MSYEVIFDCDDDSARQIATNNGWHRLCDWVNGRCGDLQELVNLSQLGQSQHLDQLTKDIKVAVKRRLDTSNRSILLDLLKFLRKRKGYEVITITDGM
jgi:hypothetical protein